MIFLVEEKQKEAEPQIESPEQTATHAFIQHCIAGYYKRFTPLPSELARREFGFGFTKKINFRHRAFSSASQLQDYLRREVPFFVSYSAALYGLPGVPSIEKKGFGGADLIFDLDNTYLHEKHEHNPLLCHYCLNRVREDTLALIERFLLGDFGFSEKELSVNYSGSKGYHVHLQGDAVRQLSSNARKQLLSYITAFDFDGTRILRREQIGKAKDAFVLRGPSKSSLGWNKKFFDSVYSLIKNSGAEQLRAAGVSSQKANKLIESRELVLRKISEGNWDALRGMEKLWEKLLSQTVERNAVQVDRAVSFDLARLIRLPDSIHGDTGFVARKMRLKELPSFEPWKDALSTPLDAGTEWVRPLESGVLEVGGQSFVISSGKVVELPTTAALFLACKKKAIIR